jgi:hypothetical protein
MLVCKFAVHLGSLGDDQRSNVGAGTAPDCRENERIFFSKRSHDFVKALGNGLSDLSHGVGDIGPALETIQPRHANP